MAKRTISKEVLSEVRLFLGNLKKYKISVKQAFIFGSYAKGNNDSDSDIDVAVVSENLGKNRLKEMMLLRKLALKTNSHIEPIPFSPSDLNDTYSALSAEVRTYGVKV